MKKFLQLLFLGLVFNSSSVFAGDVTDIQERWAIANYELAGDSQSAAFEQLIADVETRVEAAPRDAELLIWKAIVESTYAGKTSGFQALGLVKSARDALEQALEINPMALDGSAYTSLGALYYQVPPWPIAFGSSKKARKYLEKALEINPHGIDPNYFYGAFLAEEEEWEAARAALQHALEAPARPGRELADRGRRREIQQLLSDIETEA